jgi:hypothetical protein
MGMDDVSPRRERRNSEWKGNNMNNMKIWPNLSSPEALFRKKNWKSAEEGHLAVLVEAR